MSDTKIEKVGVLGCGLMGSGIAHVCAAAGYDVLVREIDEEYWKKGFEKIGSFMQKAVEKEKMAAGEKEAAMERLTGTTELSELADRDLVIEAVVEDIEEKNAMFRELDELCPDHTIFASNTSSLTIVEMAAATDRPDRTVGLHFFNPVPVMGLVEVVKAITTSDETFETAWAFAESLGKIPIEAKDRSGFVVNLLLVPYLLGAVRAVESGVASIEDIDKGMVHGTNQPMGPLTLLDFVGIDTTFRIAEIMFEEYKEPVYAAPPLLRKMHLAGYHGRKTGKGFYDYSGDEPVPMNLNL
ncbi:MAG: 3-hydroxybutyryl-CoA dehydrogenase [Gemmatimonadota bacterium]|nr:3-hydroxybutyryl-CoA dehydrogenase [Gemmatimonadota bacterium]